ncbi:MAG: neutral/alkaline non-lysosomal ceramidase N-terminal domain-containing protein [Chthoniobacteraceae bacterium]
MKTNFLLLAAILLISGFARADEATPWKAGAASVVITPDSDMAMAGYAARNKPSEGKAQNLFAKSLALEDASGGRFVFVTMDLIGVPRELRTHLEKRVYEAYALPPAALLLNASHTHCGPSFSMGKNETYASWDASTAGERYGAQLEEKIFAVIGAALKDLAPSKLSYSHARAGFAMNRRLPTDKGFQNSPYPDGPVDQDVPVLSVRGAEGNLRAVLFGYACHNTTLAFYQFCGDYAGFAQEYLQADHAGTTALFLNGCSGDQNPYPRGTLEFAQRHGRALAMAVEAALTVASPRTIAGPVRATMDAVNLKYGPIPTREEFAEQTQSKDKTIAAHARRVLTNLEKEGTLPESYPYPVQVAHFGDDLVLVALGGEVVVDYALRLKKELAGKAAVWIAGYSNDVMGYIPSRRVREEGGYEGETAMRYTSHPAPWAPELEEKIIGNVHELHDQLAPPATAVGK